MPTWTITHYILSVLSIIMLGCRPSPNNAPSATVDSEATLKALEEKGFELYQRNPREAIEAFKQVATAYAMRSNFPKAAIFYLNIASIYDEHLLETDSALIYADLSLKHWIELQDTMQMANLFKYTGLLKGKTGQFRAAEQDIHQALQLYREVEFPQGLAVSRYNLADVYFRQERFTESDSLLELSTSFWRDAGDMQRVFTNNLLGIQLFRKHGYQNEAVKLIMENVFILEQAEIDSFNIRRFNELSGEGNKAK